MVEKPVSPPFTEPKGVPRYEPFETDDSRKKAGFTRELFAHTVLMSFIIAFLGYGAYVGISRCTYEATPPQLPPPPLTRAMSSVRKWLYDVGTLLCVV